MSLLESENFYYDPKIWGPHYWFFLHTIVLIYPNYPTSITKKAYYNFFRELSRFLPVGSIASEYDKLLLKHPIVPYLDDRKSLFKWICLIHNEINKKLEYPEISTKKAIKRYYKQYFKKKEKEKRIIYGYIKFFLYLFVVFILSYFIIFYHNY